jgi:hypothetical protein
MTPDPITVTSEPVVRPSGRRERSAVQVDPDTGVTAEQERAAEVLAEGGRLQQAAEAAGCTIQTVQRWCNEQAFIEYTVNLRASQRAQRAAKRSRRIRQAYDIEHEVLSGRLDADDPRAVRAAAILRDTEDRVYRGDDDDSVDTRVLVGQRKPRLIGGGG